MEILLGIILGLAAVAFFIGSALSALLKDEDPQQLADMGICLERAD